jgi:acylphosphatase
MERKRFRVHGRVQGVGFRAWLAGHAGRLRLRGWACNRSDGSVELEVAGEVAAIAQLEELLARGPRLARVDRIEELSAGGDPLPEVFEIVAGRR